MKKDRGVALGVGGGVLVFVGLIFSSSHLIWIVLLGLVVIVLGAWSLWRKFSVLQASYEKLVKEKQQIEKENERLVKLSQEYELLFNSFTRVALVMVDKSSNDVHFSKGVEDLFGFSQQELNAYPNLWKSLIHQEDRAKVDQVEKALECNEEAEVDCRILLDGEEKWIQLYWKAYKDGTGHSEKVFGKFRDISKQKRLELELRQMAFFDDLTDLPNRKMLDRHIEKALSRAKRHQHNFTLMFVDLDDFKIVNDTHGHDVGDQLLKQVVSRLHESIREEDLIARIGGDEFIVVFEETTKEEIEDIAKRIVSNVSLPYDLEGIEAKISLSIGVSMYPEDGEDKSTLIQNADKAMYHAKHNGKNHFVLYTPELEEMEPSEVGVWARWKNFVQSTKFW
ncbi:sensor domain-containing diguanylate cyclase [Halalkalibacter krulwichiae]|uniref:Cyclic di-GMP phosphodiesterase Gmr n=1 Tax=Halalkalibacter krulwichiae TaxID=199441 RepID=A0A1X9MJ01_9BACI|nr:sensor domain-containing diguanylate cyclase [Halalkalibacter krulwichiae]ARK32273.1 Cyclic di-GMP phosphodiesterase Gmr [Halalkalibacter krulwichiae]